MKTSGSKKWGATDIKLKELDYKITVTHFRIRRKQGGLVRLEQIRRDPVINITGFMTFSEAKLRLEAYAEMLGEAHYTVGGRKVPVRVQLELWSPDLGSREAPQATYTIG